LHGFIEGYVLNQINWDINCDVLEVTQRNSLNNMASERHKTDLFDATLLSTIRLYTLPIQLERGIKQTI